MKINLSDEDIKIIEKYGKFFRNTGGGDIVKLILRDDITYFNNPILAELQGCCVSQLLLIKTLLKENLLKE